MSKMMLGEVAKEYKSTIKDHTGMPVVGLEHIEPEELELRSYDVDDEKTFSKGFKQGQILFGRRRAYLKKAAVAPFDGVCSGDIIVIEAIPDKILPDLLPFIIQNDLLFDYAMSKSAGGMSPRVKWKDLKEYEFDLPEMDEQSRLLDILKSANAARTAYKKMIDAIDELIKSQFIEMFGDPVTNTKGREVKPFSDFMTNIRYGTSQPPAFSEDGEYKFIRATNIKAGRITETDMLRINQDAADKIQKCKLDGNEIIIVRSGANTGDTCVVTEDYRGQYAGYDIIISLDLSRSNPVFFNELMNTHYMQSVIKPLTVRSAQPHLNTKQVQNLPMLVASLDEQNAFADFVEQSDKSKFELKKAISNVEVMIKTIVREGLD